MSTFKKVLALTLALAMVLSVSAFAGYSKDTYKDSAAINEDCEEAIELMYALEIMQGDNNGNFNPEATITRAEIAKMIYVILNYGDDDKAVNYTGAKIFSDVTAGSWYEGYVNYCATTKLVQGRGDGTFGPSDPVTCAEAAKMLLTAIGYSAEARGYTGANWAQNVLSDAAILGLLDGYKYNTNAYAPRQWVAVMFENALGCYTFDTMVPSFNGLLTSGEDMTSYDTMGGKYYDLVVTSAYLYATEDAYIATSDDAEDAYEKYTDKTYKGYAPADCLLFSDGTIVESDELGYMDLGQKFRVIYDGDDNDTVYSIRPVTSDVADAIIMDIEVETTYATSSNDAKNKYVFTIDGMEAKFVTYTIPALTVEYDGTTTGKPGTITAADLKAAAGDKSADLYRAVDKNDDGEIDYIIIVPYTYAKVTKVGEHANYGEHFTATDVNGNTYKPAGYTGDKWYLDDVVNTEDEIVKGNYIKVNYNLDNGAYDVEVLDVAEAVVYEKRTTKGVHTLGGEEYVVGINGFEAKDAVLTSSNLKEEMDVVYDGTLVIYAEVCDSNYSDLADINAQLVMVTEVYSDVYTNASYTRNYIEYMTIDGELHEEVRYHDSKAASADYGVEFSEIAAMLENNQRLFALREKDGKVYLLDLMDAEGKDNSQAILDYSSSLLDGYTESNAKLDTEDNEFGDDYLESENSFFVSYWDEDSDEDGEVDADEIGFDVMTIDEMSEGEAAAEDAFLQGLFTEKRSYNLYLAGHLWIEDLKVSEDKGYLYTTSGDAYDVDDDEWYLMDVVFDDGEAEGDIQVAKVNGAAISDENAVEANRLYSYTYKMDQGEKVYNLTLIDELNEDGSAGYRCDVSYSDSFFADNNTKYELTNLYVADNGDELVVADHDTGREKLTMSSSYTIALKKVVLDRNQNQNEINDELYFDIETEIAFVDFATLIDEEAESELAYCLYEDDDDTYNYYSDYYYVGAKDNVKMLYVITYAVEKEAQDNDLEELKEDAIAALEEYAEAAAAANSKTVEDAAIKAALAEQIDAVEAAADAEAVEAIVKNEHPNYGTGILAIWNAAAAQ